MSEGIIGLLEVTESDSPSLPNSLHSSNSCLGSSTSACARVSRAACAVASVRVCPVASSSAEVIESDFSSPLTDSKTLLTDDDDRIPMVLT